MPKETCRKTKWLGSHYRSFVLILTTLGLHCVSENAQAAARNINFSTVSIEEGLSQSSVYSIVQDSIGFMWFGTENGLNRYDGYSFRVFKDDPQDPPHLTNSFIWCVYEDRRGVLWIGTKGGLNRWNPDSQSFTHFNHDDSIPTSLSSDDVRVIYEDSRGTLWIGTDGGLNLLDRESIRFTGIHHNPSNPNSLSSDHIRAIYEDRQGVVWVGTYDRGLNRYDRDSGIFKHYLADPDAKGSLSNNKVWSVMGDRNGFLWIGTQDGLNRLDPETDTFKVYRHDDSDPTSLSENQVRVITEDNQGVLWIGTEDGLNEWDPSTDSFLRYKQSEESAPGSLSDDHILSLYGSRTGLLWVGTRMGGLNKWNAATGYFAHYQSDPQNPSSLSSKYVTSFVEDKDGSLWVGTFGAGLDHLDRKSGKIRNYRREDSDPRSLSGDRVMALLVDRSNRLWVATFNDGLNLFERSTKTFTHFLPDPENGNTLSGDRVTSLLEDDEGVLWIGTYGHGLNRMASPGGPIVHYSNDPRNPTSLSRDIVMCLHQDSEGILWVGTEGGGLDRFDPASGTFAHYRHDPEDPKSLSSNNVTSIYEDSRGTLWIATYGDGLNRWERSDREAHIGYFKRYRERDGLPDLAIYGILEDDSGYIWLSTNRGISKLDPQKEVFKNYDKSHGLQDHEFNIGAYYKNPGGEMFFGGINGFNAFHPSAIRDNPNVPPLVLTGFYKFNRLVDLGKPISLLDEIELTYEDNFISFEFAALDYTAPHKNRYAVKLEGFDQNWIDLGEMHRATYTNLDGGNYVFRVRGANNDGVWNEEGVSLKLTVSPPPWKSWWANILYVVALTCVGFAFVRAQQRKLKREAEYRRKLEQDVEARTVELAQRNGELQELNVELQQLNAKFEEASLTDSLTGLWNRRFLSNYMEKEVSLVLRETINWEADGSGDENNAPTSLVLLMIDLDGFKPINDQYGHAAGDEILLQMRDLLRGACRASEVLVRLGGDEFLIVGRTPDRKSTQFLAERIRRSIEAHEFDIGAGKAIQLACSVGFTCFPFLRSEPKLLNWEQVLAVTDQALYAAKHTARNAWVGLFDTEKTASNHLFQSLLNDPQTLLNGGQIDVVSSIPKDRTLDWGLYKVGAPSRAPLR